MTDDRKQQPTKKLKVEHETTTLHALEPLDAAGFIKQESVNIAVSPYHLEPQEDEELRDDPKRIHINEQQEPGSQSPATELELLEYESDPESSAQAPSCLDEARKLFRASTEMQRHQFVFLVQKLRNVLRSRTRFEAAEAIELAQAIDIATQIGMNATAVRPSSPALGDLVLAADHFRELTGGGSVCVHVWFAVCVVCGVDFAWFVWE